MEQLLALWTPGVQDGVISTLIVAVVSAIGVGILKWWSGLSLKGLYKWCMGIIFHRVEIPIGLILLFLFTLGCALLTIISEEPWAYGVQGVSALVSIVALVIWSVTELLKSQPVIDEVSAILGSPGHGDPAVAASLLKLDDHQIAVLSFLGYMRRSNIQQIEPAKLAKAVDINVLFVEQALDSLAKLGLASDVWGTGHAYSLSPAGRIWLIENNEVL